MKKRKTKLKWIFISLAIVLMWTGFIIYEIEWTMQKLIFIHISGTLAGIALALAFFDYVGGTNGTTE